MAAVFGHGPRRRLAPVLLVAALVAGALAPSAVAKGPTAGPKNYLPSAAPTVVPLPAAATATVDITLANCGVCEGVRSSSQAFGSAQIRFLTSAPLVTSNLAAPRSGWTIVRTADASTGITTLELGNTGIGTTLAVQPGESVTVRIPVASTAAPGQISFTTQVKQSNDFSGTGNDFLPAAADPVVYLGSGPAKTLEFVRQPTTIQGSSEGSGTGTTPILTTCASVRALDVFGHVATSFTGSVALSPSDSGLGLKLGSSSTIAADAVAGVATFGTGTPCGTDGLSATKLGFGYTLTASSTGVTSAVSSAFDVLQFYANCGASCSAPKRTSGGTTSSADASSASNDPLPFTFLVGQGTWPYGDTCNPDVGADGANPYRSQVTVDLDGHSKTVTVLWSKQAVQWAINNGASLWRVCIATTYPFAAVGGAATAVGSGIYVGALLPCGNAALGATDPCLQKLNKSGGQQQAVVLMPQRDGDPRMI